MVNSSISTLARTLLAASLSLSFAACSLVPTVPSVGPGPGEQLFDTTISAADHKNVCDASLEYGEAACERAQRCGNEWSLWAWDRTQCAHQTASILAAFTVPYYGYAGSSTSSAQSLRDCAAKLRENSCEPVTDCALFSQWTSKKRLEGVECDSTSQCKEGLACLDAKCAPLRTEGGNCTGSEQCARGLSCQGKYDAQHCAPVVENATKCRTDDECAVERGEEGYALFTFWSFGGGMHCDDATLVCRRPTRTAKLDEACDTDRLCGDGLYCQGLLSAVGGAKCRPVAKYGEPCDNTNCVSCENGICRDPLDRACK